jgi:hypothetical protein
MADNYLEFSVALDLKSDEERRWLQQQLEEVEHEAGDDMPRFLLDYPDRDEGETFAGFEVAWHDDSVSFYAEEGVNVGHLVHLVQKFLRQFRPNEAWSVTWAETCSKPHVDEFGGGAAFVTADEVKWMSAHQFVEEQLAAFEAGRDRQQEGDGVS